MLFFILKFLYVTKQTLCIPSYKSKREREREKELPADLYTRFDDPKSLSHQTSVNKFTNSHRTHKNVENGQKSKNIFFKKNFKKVQKDGLLSTEYNLH